MTEDLIARLRSVDVSWSETGEWCAEAADRIEALTAEVERLREALEWYVAEDEKYIRAALAGDSHDQ